VLSLTEIEHRLHDGRVLERRRSHRSVDALFRRRNVCCGEKQFHFSFRHSRQQIEERFSFSSRAAARFGSLFLSFSFTSMIFTFFFSHEK